MDINNTSSNETGSSAAFGDPQKPKKKMMRTKTKTNNTKTMTQNQGVSVAPTRTEDQMVTVEVTLTQVVSNLIETTFKVTVPRSDAENHDVLLKACDDQEQEQDAFGYGERQAGEWQYEYQLQDLAIDVLDSEVVSSKITGTVEEDED